MTDHLPPLSDEDLSAALDGEAPPEVVARIAADPGAQARSAALAAVRNAVAEQPDPLRAAAVDELIVGALAAVGTTGEGGGDASDQDVDDRIVAPLRSAAR